VSAISCKLFTEYIQDVLGIDGQSDTKIPPLSMLGPTLLFKMFYNVTMYISVYL